VREPIVNWSFPELAENKIQKIIKSNFNSRPFVALVPSAAWEMKRWPLDHWKELVLLLPNHDFAVLGGKEDLFAKIL